MFKVPKTQLGERLYGISYFFFKQRPSDKDQPPNIKDRFM